MRKVYTLGETVYDIIFKEMSVSSGGAGGATLNSAVSLGRMNKPVAFLGEYGNDLLGSAVDEFLRNNGVDTSYVYRYVDGNTSVAIAFLDQDSNASYDFYKKPPCERMKGVMPEFTEEDILLFGSFFAIDPNLRETVVSLVSSARRAGALVVYDPNFRLAHKDELESIRPYILENFGMADIIRGSNEDFMHIFGVDSVDSAAAILKPYSECLFYSSSRDGVYIRTPSFSGMIPSIKINPVSTVGAGDTLNAGIIYGLLEQNVYRKDLASLNPITWQRIISIGISMATEVCMSYENYIPKGFQV